MGVHHGWGRTLKDIWQRYAAMRGCDLLYQNGFDCQGLWVEVGVEKELGLNSKREIEEYGLDRFSRACRDRVAHFSGDLTYPVEAARPVDGLGAVVLHDDRPQHLLHLGLPQAVQRAGMALQGPPLDAVVPALRDLALPARADRLLQGPDPSVAPRPPAARRPRSRVPGRVDDDAVDAPGERRRRRPARRRVRRASRPASGIAIVAAARLEASPIVGRGARHGARLRARRAHLHGAVRRAPRPAGVREPGRGLGRRVDGGGHRHRPHRPRAAARRTSSSASARGSSRSSRSTRPARSSASTAGCTATSPPRRPR